MNITIKSGSSKGESTNMLILYPTVGSGIEDNIYNVFFMTAEKAYYKEKESNDLKELISDLRGEYTDALVLNELNFFDSELEIELLIQLNENEQTRFLRRYSEYMNIIERVSPHTNFL